MAVIRLLRGFMLGQSTQYFKSYRGKWVYLFCRGCRCVDSKMLINEKLLKTLLTISKHKHLSKTVLLKLQSLQENLSAS